jgi:hypothetical protein
MIQNTNYLLFNSFTLCKFCFYLLIRTGCLKMLVARFFCLLLFTLCLGCGGKPVAKLFPANGKITVQGKPLGYGRVIYKPIAGGDAEESRGTIDATGSYTMHTGDRPGVPAGSYVVQVFAISPESEKDSTKPPVWGANVKYTQPESGLKIEVSETTPAEKFNFDLQP